MYKVLLNIQKILQNIQRYKHIIIIHIYLEQIYRLGMSEVLPGYPNCRLRNSSLP